MEDIRELFDEEPVSAPSDLAELVRMGEVLVNTEREIEELEALLKALKGNSTEIKTRTLPDKMAELGLSEFSLDDGTKIKVSDFVSGTLPKEADAREAALAEIEAWGAEGVIKNEINMTFEKSQHNEAMALVDDLRLRGYHCDLKSGIHPQTYLALMRERLASGDPIDLQKMNIFVGRQTKVTAPKGRK
jgi:hypothetical protein